MKKILILANNSTGLYNFRAELIEKLISDNFSVYFSLPEDETDSKVKLLKELGAHHIKTFINRRGMNLFEEVKLLNEYKKIVSKLKPDIILTYTIKPNIYGSLISKISGTPLIMNVTGLGSTLSEGKKKFLFKHLYKYASSGADVIFFQNKENMYYFEKNKLVNKEKIKLIPGSGVNIKKFSSNIKNIACDKTVFTFIGRIMKEKGIEEFLYAAKEISKKNTEIEFHIVGPFEEEEYKKALSNIRFENIKYLGVSEDVRKQISDSTCIVNPSYHEGMSNVLLEAASMSKPLIASNISGCKEIIDDGVNGFLFKVKDSEDLLIKMEKFISLNSISVKRMGKESRRKVVLNFDRNIIIREYINSINSLF